MFNPNDHLIQIKNRNGSADYLPVQFRLVWFREMCPDGTIETEMIHLDLDRETEEETYQWNNETRRSEKVTKHAQGICIFRATVSDGKGGKATGTKSEKAASFPDFIEKAETGSIGRALAALGYGTQFAPELNEEHRIVDAPVDRGQPPTNGHGKERVTEGTQVLEALQNAKPSPQQLTSIEKLAEKLGKEVEAPKSYGEAKDLLIKWSKEYNESKNRK